MEDLGLKSFHSEVDYEQIDFAQQGFTLWLPDEAVVEVRTQKQYWKNVHRFSAYHLFTVSTTTKVDLEKVKQKADQ